MGIHFAMPSLCLLLTYHCDTLCLYTSWHAKKTSLGTQITAKDRRTNELRISKCVYLGSCSDAKSKGQTTGFFCRANECLDELCTTLFLADIYENMVQIKDSWQEGTISTLAALPEELVSVQNPGVQCGAFGWLVNLVPSDRWAGLRNSQSLYTVVEEKIIFGHHMHLWPCVLPTHPFIHHLYLLPSAVKIAEICWSPSHALGRRWSPPWTSRQFVTGRRVLSYSCKKMYTLLWSLPLIG